MAFIRLQEGEKALIVIDHKEIKGEKCQARNSDKCDVLWIVSFFSDGILS